MLLPNHIFQNNHRILPIHTSVAYPAYLAVRYIVVCTAWDECKLLPYYSELKSRSVQSIPCCRCESRVSQRWGQFSFQLTIHWAMFTLWIDCSWSQPWNVLCIIQHWSSANISELSVHVSLDRTASHSPAGSGGGGPTELKQKPALSLCRSVILLYSTPHRRQHDHHSEWTYSSLQSTVF